MVENNDNNYDVFDSICYYEDGEVIFTEGSYGDEMYVIHSGEVEISRMTNEGKKVLTILTKDGFFGEMALLSDSPRTATAISIGKSVLLPFDKEAMMRRIESNPRFAMHLLTSLSERLMKTTASLTELIDATEKDG